MFTAMRVLSGFEATFQQVAGQTFIADVFDAVSAAVMMRWVEEHTLIIAICRGSEGLLLAASWW